MECRSESHKRPLPTATQPSSHKHVLLVAWMLLRNSKLSLLLLMKSNVLYLKRKKNLCSQCLNLLNMQCFKCGSEAEPFNSLTWVLQASYVPVRALDWLCPRYEMDMFSCICRCVVILTQSSLQSRRNKRLYTSLQQRSPPSGGSVYRQFFFLLLSEVLNWAAAILTHLNQWTLLCEQCEWFRRMKMAWMHRLTCFVFSLNCQKARCSLLSSLPGVLCRTLKDTLPPSSSIPNKILDIAVTLFPFCANIS